MKTRILTTAILLLLVSLLSTLKGTGATYANIEPTAEPDVITSTAYITETTALTVEDEPILGGTIPQTPTSNRMFLPLLLADGQPRNFPEDTVVAAAVGGFDRDMIEVGVQDWWMPSYGHVHADVRLPFAGTVSGILSIPVRVVMHDNPGKLHLFTIGLENETVGQRVNVRMGDLSCAVSVCAWGFNVNLDTRTLKDGCRELRIKAYINTPDGKQMITSSGVPVNVKNGGSSSDFNKSCVTGQMIGRGWYTSINYINSVFESVPTTPVHGTITIGFRAAGEASSHLTVELDKSHFIPAVDGWPEVQATSGTVLFDKDGNFTKFQHITIDTRTLSNGWHNLAVRSTSLATAKTNGVDNHALGVARYKFYVQN